MSDEEFKQKEKYIDQQMQRGKVVLDKPTVNVYKSAFDNPSKNQSKSGNVNTVFHTQKQQEKTTINPQSSINPTPMQKTTPHIYTAKDLDKMSQEEFDKNLPEVERQISKGLIR